MTLILCSGHGYSQTRALPDSMVRDEFPRRVYLQTRDGKSVRGFYLGTRGDTLVLLHQRAEVGFPFENMAEVRIEGNRESTMPIVVSSAILSGYAVASLAAGTHDTPYGYVDPYNGSTAPLVIGIGTGLAVGYLVSVLLPSSSAPSEHFLFGGGTDQDQRMIEEFRSFLHPGQKTERFHLTVHGGSISTRSSSVPVMGPYDSYYSYSYSSGVSINLVRRIQFSYSITPVFEVGIALVRLTEPPIMLWRHFSANGGGGYGSYQESLTGTAFLLVGGVQPLRQILPEELAWKIDLGIGYAPVTFVSTTKIAMNSYQPYETNYVQNRTGFDGPRLGLMLGTTFDVYLYDHLSVGFSAEYTLAVGSSLPAVPEFDVPARWCGNSCIGINLGLHF